MSPLSMEQKAAAFDHLWNELGDRPGRCIGRVALPPNLRLEESPPGPPPNKVSYVTVPTYEYVLAVRGEQPKFRDVLYHLATHAKPADPLVVKLGFGRVEVIEGDYAGKPALLFSGDGSGEIGKPIPPNRFLDPARLLAAITFENTASLSVVLEVLQRLRDRVFRDEEVG